MNTAIITCGCGCITKEYDFNKIDKCPECGKVWNF